MNIEQEITAIKNILSVLSIFYTKTNPQNAFEIGRLLEGLLLSNQISIAPELKVLALHLSQNLLGNLDQPVLFDSSSIAHQSNQEAYVHLKQTLDQLQKKKEN